MFEPNCTFSNINRQSRVSKAIEVEYDLIVIGGGVTGAGIAFDASNRGLKTLLLEKTDFASGTSSKSTKLIHGGLRYLKQFEFGLVRETGLERAVVHRNIPHLVHPEKMLLPIVKGGEFNMITATLAIGTYDWLAKVPKEDRKKTLSRKELLEMEPLLQNDVLKSGIVYSEYRTDDARLTIELIKAAKRFGAEIFNYMEVEDFVYNEGKVRGVKAYDSLKESAITFKSRHVVSAAGPWVDKLRDENNSLFGKRLHLTKGVHIVVPHSRFPLNNSVYFDAFDGRMIFAIPRGKSTYIGTSDTTYNLGLDSVLCTSEDVDYLINKVNKMFSTVRLSSKDVVSSWAGLRPLIHEDGKTPSELSRKDELFISESELISIAGGKLTGFRRMSKKIVDLLIRIDSSLPKVRCRTKNLPIHEHSFLDYKSYLLFIEDLKKKSHLKLDNYQFWYLVTNYGKQSHYILNQSLNHHSLSDSFAVLRAEIDFVIKYESATMPDDYFNRRSGRLYFDIESTQEYFDFIIDSFSEHFGWSQFDYNQIRARCRQLILDVTEFKSEVLIK